MVQNEGELDRILRVVVGTCLFWFSYVSFEGWIKWTVFLITLEMIVSGFIGYSGIYKKFGVSTNSKKIKA